jgi:formylglycine-generating enzyme required for sulfatase activity
VLHRDIKLGNLLVRPEGEGFALRVIDFGLALRPRQAQATVHQSLLAASVAGTLDFAAPEQCGRLPGAEVGTWSDVYAFGKTLAYCLTGRTELSRRDWHRLEDRDPGLADLLERCVEFDPRRRCRDLGEVLAVLALPLVQDIHGWPAERVQALQRATAAALGREVVFRDRLRRGGEGPEMVVIPAGSFLMGSPGDEPERRDNERQHRVQIAYPFAIGRYAVTFEEYDAFCRASGHEKPNDRGWGRGRRPVINVSWEDAVAYAEWVSAETGQVYRLATEAEWEYACRAGMATAFWLGNQLTTEQANYDGNYPYAGGPKGLYREKTVEVGSLPANSWGLYEVHGNVWEWCSDWYGEYPGGTTADPTGPTSGVVRVLRGGSWFRYGRHLRSACRLRVRPGFRNRHIAFRLARGQSGRGAERQEEGAGSRARPRHHRFRHVEPPRVQPAMESASPGHVGLIEGCWGRRWCPTVAGMQSRVFGRELVDGVAFGHGLGRAQAAAMVAP